MISVTFLQNYRLHGTDYTKHQIAFIDPAWVQFLDDKKIIRITHRKDVNFLLFQKGRHV